MAENKYLFQRKKTSFTKRLFEKGLNASALILFSMRESGKLFFDGLPSCYPGIKIFKDIFGSTRKKDFNRNDIVVNLKRLEEQGLIRKEAKKKIYILTEEGEELIEYIKDRYDVLNKKWDRKMRVVVFDIPEKNKYLRVWVRSELGLLDFKELQKSVYVGKFPLPESFYEDLFKFELNRNVFIFIVSEIDKNKEVLKVLNS